jgi:hypothetical protein
LNQDESSVISHWDMIPVQIQRELDDFYSSNFKEGNDGKCEYRGGSPRKKECEILVSLMLQMKPPTTIDWGLGDAAACISIVLAKQHLGIRDRHISLDPYQSTTSKDVGLIQLQQRKLDDDVEFLAKRSDDYLVAAAALGRTFDFIFVDGDHSLGGKVADAHLADRVLRPGGVIAFHDGLFNSTATAVQYLLEEQHYELIRLESDPRWKMLRRQVRHAWRLGAWYALNVIPSLGISIACLKKPSTTQLVCS